MKFAWFVAWGGINAWESDPSVVMIMRGAMRLCTISCAYECSQEHSVNLVCRFPAFISVHFLLLDISVHGELFSALESLSLWAFNYNLSRFNACENLCIWNRRSNPSVTSAIHIQKEVFFSLFFSWKVREWFNQTQMQKFFSFLEERGLPRQKYFPPNKAKKIV